MDAADQPGGSEVRYVLALGPNDIGARVVIRRRLADGGLGDLLGELLAWDADAVVVRDRHGVSHPIDPVDIVAGKQVPPAPARRGTPR